MSGGLSRTTRLSILGLLLGLVIAGLAASVWAVASDGVGTNPIDRVESLQDPPADQAATREQVMAAARTFIQRFHTYGPDMLDEATGTMPDYAKVGDLMTAKARTVFDKLQACVAEPVKAKAALVGAPLGIGAFAVDTDSAHALVAGTLTVSYPSPANPKEMVDFAPTQFRYDVSLVRQNGTWLIDDFDNRDDDAGWFAQQENPCGSVEQTPQSGAGTPAPSQGATP